MPRRGRTSVISPAGKDIKINIISLVLVGKRRINSKASEGTTGVGHSRFLLLFTGVNELYISLTCIVCTVAVNLYEIRNYAPTISDKEIE